jgi:RecA-family ATPase
VNPRVENVLSRLPPAPARDECPRPDVDEVTPLPTLGFQDVATRRVEWLWRGRIPYGKVTIFDGQPGQAKSSVALDIAARLTHGRGMPDGVVPERGAGGVLIVSAEDDPADTVAPRLLAAGADLDRARFFGLQRDDAGNIVPLAIPDDLRRLACTVQEHDLHLVVIDPLVAYLNERVDSNNDASIRRALGPLNLTAAETGAAFVGIRHLNKGVGLSALDRGGGSVGIGGNARSVLLFAAHPDQEENPNLRVMASAKGNLAARPSTLGYRVDEELVQLDDGHVVGLPVIVWQRDPVHLSADQLVGFKADARKDTPERDAAAEWLEDVLADGPLPAKELQKLADQAGHAWATVKRAKDGVARSVRERNADGSTGQWLWRLLRGEDDLEAGE